MEIIRVSAESDVVFVRILFVFFLCVPDRSARLFHCSATVVHQRDGVQTATEFNRSHIEQYRSVPVKQKFDGFPEGH